MVNTMKKIVGLVKSGALKDKFTISIDFQTESGDIDIVGEKEIYSPKDSIIFLKDLTSEIKVFENKKSDLYSASDIEKYPLLFSILDEENRIKFTQKQTSYLPKLIVRTMTLIGKNGKPHVFNMNRKNRGMSSKIAKIFKLD